jgi:hypothetical protein
MASQITASEPRKPTMDSSFALQTTSAHDATQPLALPLAEAPRDMGDANARKLVWFLVPSWDICGGGLLSICYFHAETRMLLSDPEVAVVASTYPNASTLKKYTAFPNSMDIFSFAEVVTYFKSVEHAILHIPEYFCKEFPSQLSPTERLFLDTIPRLQVNIMLQNIDQCKPDDIQPLRALADEITCTTAHDRYSTLEQSTRYGIPLHKLSIFVDVYEQRPWTEKQDIMVLSPDQHPLRNRVIDIIKKGLPSLELITIENMSYENYRSLIAKAKWSLTFGEGLDGYFAEMAWTGGVPFAVYNDRFFMPQFRGLPTVYDTWDELQTWIVGDILKLDHEEVYHVLGESIRQILNELYSCEKYRQSIRLFYNEQYSFPSNSPAKPRRVDEMLTRARQAIPRLKEREETRDASIAQLREGIEARDASIAQLREGIKARDASIAPLKEDVEARDASIAQLRESIAQLREGIETRDASVAKLREDIEARDASVAKLREDIEVRDANIAQLRECVKAQEASIEDFRQSTSWKLTAPLRLTIHLFRLGITAAEKALSELSALHK